jgi:molybdopterin-guanine dinucleotide biosynthesis protein A
MGRDKALLPFQGRTLVEHVATQVEAAAGSVALVGEPSRYGHLGYPVVRDVLPGAGPLGGIYAALGASAAAWNLVVACDMPAIRAPLLEELLGAAETSGTDGLIPMGPEGLPEPLCAVYHADCLPRIKAALAGGVRKVMEGLAGAAILIYKPSDLTAFENCNTPAQWAAYNK